MNQILISAILSVVIIGGIGYSESHEIVEIESTEEVDAAIEEVIEEPTLDTYALAICLEESETEFFGVYWCPHCTDQKALFGDNADLLPYIECDANGTNPQVEYCTENGITAYPTWIFEDGSTLLGTQSLETLNEAAECGL